MSSEEQRRALEENGRRIGEEIRALERTRLEALMEMHPACPVDGLPGAYVGLYGAFGLARITFICPNQDAFTLNRENGQMRVIRPESQRFIRRETLALLHDTSPSDPRDADAEARWRRDGE